MPRLSDGERERTAVCLTAGRHRRTQRTDAQVTTLPGVKAITPSKLKVHFYMLRGRFCKPVISHLTTSAVWCLTNPAFGCIHQYTSVSVYTIRLHLAISQIERLFIGMPLHCFTLQDVFSVCTFVPSVVFILHYMPFVITLHARRCGIKKPEDASLPFAAHGFIFAANCKDP